MRRSTIAAWLIYSALTICALAQDQPPEKPIKPAHTRLQVSVSIPPQAQLVERIAGEYAQVNVIVQPGQGPHTYEPSPRQIMEICQSDLLFYIGGMPFESRLIGKLRDAAPDGAGPRIVHVGQGAGGDAEDAVQHEAHDHEVHQHAEDHHHDETVEDPHIWLGPPQLKIIAENTAQALIDVDPAHAPQYRENLRALLDEIEALHAECQRDLAPFNGRRVYVYHPAFGCFLSAYGLQQEAVELEGRQPTPRRLLELTKQARRDGVKVIFVQPQFDPKSAEILARGIDGRIVALDPLARDVLGNLRRMSAAIRDAMIEAPGAETASPSSLQ
ncbi:zinc ABC transporter substrate-binding protein [Candidatus Sumerlaeota bacterium]|nr:zinc ABC transporter substrate-binding protein [Candidatus Sumerlaeota bacterium]